MLTPLLMVCFFQAVVQYGRAGAVAHEGGGIFTNTKFSLSCIYRLRVHSERRPTYIIGWGSVANRQTVQ